MKNEKRQTENTQSLTTFKEIVMKSIVNRIVVVVMIGALASVAAMAKTHKQRVTFDNDIKVNGTVVKKGSYDLKFDDETGQLSIVKNGKTVAQTMARLEARDKKANGFQLRATTSGDETQLVGVTFGGWDKDVVIGSNGAVTGNN
jgi:protein tyrosine phosphatase